MDRIGNSVAVLRGLSDSRAYEPFRQDNNFYYLTGVATPDAVLLLDGGKRRSVLFLPPRDKEKEKWEIPLLYAGLQARRITGVDKVMELPEFGSELRKRLQGSSMVYTPLMPYETAASSQGRAMRHDSKRMENVWDGRKSRESAFQEKLKEAVRASLTVKDLSPVLDEMRRIKDTAEIELLRAAGRIGSLGLKEAIRSAKPGMYEYQLAALAKFVYLWHGASGEAFFPIVGSGPNSCVLHYYRKQRRMESGDIVVMDFGPDFRYYVSDITRTFPVSGKFSKEQAEVYRVVLQAQKAALEAVRPGATFDDVEDAARKVLGRSGFEKYARHAVSHYVGMSVHDVGDSVPFEPGVVIAVEPGVYIPDRDLGVRIEDTVLVTDDGFEVLSRDVPKEIAEIEKLMASEIISIAVED
ncbi:MAG: aminopeptidase P family protein [Acidobacteria bacterium]|nr:aminopeptidase P family protein [Acidobacteriota bacterium]